MVVTIESPGKVYKAQAEVKEKQPINKGIGITEITLSERHIKRGATSFRLGNSIPILVFSL